MNIYHEKFIVYLTFYSGSKLPPFYIGSTSYMSILEGYHGTVTSKKYSSIWKKEILENPHLFKTRIISYHDTRIDAYMMEEYLQRKLNVVKSDMYINMSYANGGFVAERGKKLSKDWVENIRKSRIGRKHSTETRQKQSESGGHRLGKKNDPEWNRKNSESNKLITKTPEWNRKNSIANSGRIHIANTITKVRKFIKIHDAEVLISLHPNIWIKLGNRKPIPDFILLNENASDKHED